MPDLPAKVDVTVTVNGRAYQRAVEPRLLLSDFLRHELGLTGTHVGCEHGVCGACTILFDGYAARSCLMFAVQANGHAITTVEGLAASPKELHPLQQAFHDAHGLFHDLGSDTVPGQYCNVECAHRIHSFKGSRVRRFKGSEVRRFESSLVSNINK